MPIEPGGNVRRGCFIGAGPAANAARSIQSFAFDAGGNMTVTLTDGSVLPPVPCANILAAALGGKYLVVADETGKLFANGKPVGVAS